MTPARREIGYLVLCFAAASAIPFLPADAQARYSDFGFGAPPLLMLAVATVAGSVALVGLRRQGFFAAGQRGWGVGAAARWATVLAVPVIFVDLVSPFPRAINVPWPEAWLFYPSIAVVAEAVLHLVPLAIVYMLTRRAWFAILAAAMTEPVLQTAFVFGVPGWQAVFVAVQVLAIGLIELTLFRRHGLAALIGFRWVYYLHWHMLWGQVRLWLPAAGP